jgi:methyl coenzyme M reductase subunit D
MNRRIRPECDIKIEVMEACKESMLLFFDQKNDRFSKGYEMKKVYSDYKKYGEEEGFNAFRNKIFGLKLGSVVNKISST